MTLILGIRCQDGIVLGSDGASTTATLLDGQTITHATSKLEVYDGYVVIGVAGAVGMGQNFKRTLSQHITDHSYKRKPWKDIAYARDWFRDNFWPHVQPGWEHGLELNKQLNPAYHGAVLSAVNTSTLVAFPIEDECYLLELDHLCQPQEYDEKQAFVTIGSGKPHGDPFLGFIEGVFWKSRQPTLLDGIFATVWTLQHAIKLSPGGVGGPMEVVTLENTGKKGWKARKLSADELGTYTEAVIAVEEDMPQLLANFFKGRPPTIPTK